MKIHTEAHPPVVESPGEESLCSDSSDKIRTTSDAGRSTYSLLQLLGICKVGHTLVLALHPFYDLEYRYLRQSVDREMQSRHIFPVVEGLDIQPDFARRSSATRLKMRSLWLSWEKHIILCIWLAALLASTCWDAFVNEQAVTNVLQLCWRISVR